MGESSTEPNTSDELVSASTKPARPAQSEGAQASSATAEPRPAKPKKAHTPSATAKPKPAKPKPPDPSALDLAIARAEGEGMVTESAKVHADHLGELPKRRP